MSSSSVASSVLRKAPQGVRWRNWPLMDEWPRVWPMVLLLAVVTAVVWLATERAGLTALAALVTAAAMWRVFIPVIYEVNSKGVGQMVGRRMRVVPWRCVRDYRMHPAGIQLFFSDNPTAVDTLSSLYIPLSERRDEVLSVMGHYLQAPLAGF